MVRKGQEIRLLQVQASALRPEVVTIQVHEPLLSQLPKPQVERERPFFDIFR